MSGQLPEDLHQHPARRLWHCLEHVNAVTYFAEECRAANREAGFRGFWMGYFASRAAPLGAVGPSVVEALFFNFAPAMIRRALPDAWSFADPAVIVELRRQAAGRALLHIVPDLRAIALKVVPVFEACVRSAPGSGRPLFCANRDLPVPSDPVEALWQFSTALRGHRGDGHVAVLSASGLSGCEPHHLLAAERDVPAEVLRDNRGWTDAEWQQAAGDLAARGLLDGSGELTRAGRTLRDAVEQKTDGLAVYAYISIGEHGMDNLADALHESARRISRSGIIPYPNPIGLPPLL